MVVVLVVELRVAVGVVNLVGGGQRAGKEGA